MGRLTEALEAAGAKLKRAKKHLVFALPNGKTFVTASTPSDVRAEKNALRDLRAVSGVDTRERKKATPEARAERRERPGRHDSGNELASVNGAPTALAAALRVSGVVEKTLRDQLDEALAENARLRGQFDVLKAAYESRRQWMEGLEHDLHALRSMRVVRIQVALERSWAELRRAGRLVVGR